MALSKTLQGLLERAENKGTAVKRVRELQVMGSGGHWYTPEARKESPMIEQWRVDYDITQNGQHYRVYHYETLIAHIYNNGIEPRWFLEYYYGESASDRDALNGLCQHFGINAGFRYGKRIGFVPVYN